MTNWINLILAGKNHRSKYRLVFKKNNNLKLLVIMILYTSVSYVLMKYIDATFAIYYNYIKGLNEKDLKCLNIRQGRTKAHETYNETNIESTIL